jgi:hypothetical protein
VIGGKILFGRERSSAHTDDPVLLRDLMRDWGYTADRSSVPDRTFSRKGRCRDELWAALSDVRRIPRALRRRDARQLRGTQVNNAADPLRATGSDALIAVSMPEPLTRVMTWSEP